MQGIRDEYEPSVNAIKAVKLKPSNIAWSRREPANFPGPITIRRPQKLGIEVIDHFPLETLVWYIDWTPFFRTWELAGHYPEIFDDEVIGKHARSLFEDAQVMLKQIISEKWLEAKTVIGFFPANSEGDDIIVYKDESRTEQLDVLHHLRQQNIKAPEDQIIAYLTLSRLKRVR